MADKLQIDRPKPLFLFNPNRMMEAFGTDSPTLTAKADYFEGLWQEWWRNQVCFHQAVVGHRNRKHIRSLMTNLGYDHWFDFQLRGPTLRAADQEVLAVVKLNFGEFIDHAGL